MNQRQGRWVLRGGIRRWVEEQAAPTPACIECETPISDGERCRPCEKQRAMRVAKAKARLHVLRALGAHPALRTICDDCDSLTYLGEACPCVRIWCRTIESEWNRRAA